MHKQIFINPMKIIVVTVINSLAANEVDKGKFKLMDLDECTRVQFNRSIVGGTSTRVM